jgi:hypothetical protein
MAEKMPGRLRQCPKCKSKKHSVPVYHEAKRPTTTVLYPDGYAYCEQCKTFYTNPNTGGVVADVTKLIVAEYNGVHKAWMLVRGVRQ